VTGAARAGWQEGQDGQDGEDAEARPSTSARGHASPRPVKPRPIISVSSALGVPAFAKATAGSPQLGVIKRAEAEGPAASK